MAWRLLVPTVLALGIILPDCTQAISILDLFTSAVKGEEGVRLDSREAADFLQSGSGRSRRHVKWYQQNPDFQSWYKYYQTIGHNEGLYEIDRIRLTYQHMRHLESVYGKDAPYYQHTLGMGPGPSKPKGPCDPKKDGGCKRPSMGPTPHPPPAPKAQHRPHGPIPCNPQDPACLLQYVYRFLGPAQGGHPPSTPHQDQQDQEDQEDEEEEEEEDDEVDPYDPRYHGYYGDPRSYYGPNYPHGSPSKPKPNPYSSPDPYNPNPDPYNPYPYNPNPNPYNSPNTNPYDSPRPYDSSNPYGSPNNYPYPNPYNSPYSAPYGSPYGSPYKPPYHEDEDEDDEY
ncbi:actinodin3 [Leucoraja erinacea]|uniref:actinodin3 n=1 Tax=Leucoraja erinaceus TaxID=7782 RepID=UPI002456E7AC|nr:actinodin3 [Leucoraja erinacea]